MLLLNIGLTFVWLVLTQEITLGNALFGLVLSFLIIGLTERTITPVQIQVRRRAYSTRVIRSLSLLFSF